MDGNFHLNLERDNVHSDTFLNCLRISFQIWPKSFDFTYTNSNGHMSNIDHVLSCKCISRLPVPIYTDNPISDDLGLSYHLQLSQNINIQKS